MNILDNRTAYTLLLWLLLPYALLHLWWRGRRQPEYRQHIGERFGRYALTRRDSERKPVIWLHTVSVGETRAAASLILALRTRYPDHQLLLTHTTPTGRAASEQLYGDDVWRVYLPYDYPFALRRFLRHFQPQVGVLLETEVWFNLIHECRNAQVPLLLLNARLSQRSARRYARFPHLTRAGLQALGGIAAQTEDDAARLKDLGGCEVSVMGNLKFDIAPPSAQVELGLQLRTWFGTQRPVFLAASTREGEEALILDALFGKDVGRVSTRHTDQQAAPVGLHPQGAGRGCTGLKPQQHTHKPDLPDAAGERNDDLLTVIVPRHPQRFDEVARLIAQRGFRMQRRSNIGHETCAPDTQILLGDSMGELFAYYAASDIAFIGGSLLPLGGQNLIEAAAVGTPVLIGPHTLNFAQATEQAITAGAALRVQDADELINALRTLLQDDDRRMAMCLNAQRFVSENRGATERAADLIAAHL